MDTHSIQSTWSEIKSKIKNRWSRFNDIELESFKDNLSAISKQIQKTYGVTKEQAEKEFNDFKATIQAMKKPEDKPGKPNLTEAAQKDAMVSEGGSAPIKKAV